jgi:hypothetical protein
MKPYELCQEAIEQLGWDKELRAFPYDEELYPELEGDENSILIVRVAKDGEFYADKGTDYEIHKDLETGWFFSYLVYTPGTRFDPPDWDLVESNKRHCFLDKVMLEFIDHIWYEKTLGVREYLYFEVENMKYEQNSTV